MLKSTFMIVEKKAYTDSQIYTSVICLVFKVLYQHYFITTNMFFHSW